MIAATHLFPCCGICDPGVWISIKCRPIKMPEIVGRARGAHLTSHTFLCLSRPSAAAFKPINLTLATDLSWKLVPK